MGCCGCRCVPWVLRLSPSGMLVLFCLVNFLSYVDRGVIPGAFYDLGLWIKSDLGVSSTDSYIGYATSAYIVGYSVASIVTGHVVHMYPPFKVMAAGLAVWLLSIVISGFAPSYWVLIGGRVLSGVGEASFQCVVPPYIDDNAPPSKRGLWLAAFYTAIPVGTAVGYAFGGFVASALAPVGWRWMFFIEGFPMIPLIVACWFLPYDKHRRELLKEVSQALGEHSSGSSGSGGGGSGEGGGGGGTDAAAASSSAAAASSPAAAGLQRGAEAAAAAAASLLMGGLSKLTPGGKGGGGRSAVEEELLSAHEEEEEGGGAGAADAGASSSSPRLHLAGPHLHRTSSASVTDAAAAGSAGGSATGGALPRVHSELTVHSVAHYPHHVPPTDAEVLREVGDELVAAGDAAAAGDTARGRPTFCSELHAVLVNPVYLLVVFGYAGFTAVVAGVGTFAPTFILGLGLLPTAATASLAAGVVVSVAGAVGVPLGGWFVDRGTRHAKAALDAEKAKAAAAAGGDLDSGFYSPTGSTRRLPVPRAIVRSLSRTASQFRAAQPLARAASAGAMEAARPAQGSGESLSASASAGNYGAVSISPDADAGRDAAVLSPRRSALSLAAAPAGSSPGGGFRFGSPAPFAPAGQRGPGEAGGDAGESLVGVGEPVAEDAGGDDEADDGGGGGEITEIPPDDEDEDATSPEISDIKLIVTMAQAVMLVASGSLCMVAGVFATDWGIGSFLAVLCTGSLLLMGTSAGVNLAMMAAVPPQSRSFAIGVGTLLLHALGDVPAPPVIGSLSDMLSPPSCNPDDATQCTRDAAGLRDTLLATTAWLFWPVACWGAAWVLVHRRHAQRRASGFYEAWHVEHAKEVAAAHAAASARGGDAARKLMGGARSAAAGSGLLVVPASSRAGARAGTASDTYAALPADSPAPGAEVAGGGFPAVPSAAAASGARWAGSDNGVELGP